MPVGPILVLFLVACVALGAYYASQTVYFVGTSDDGFVTVYRGLPYDLPAGLHLYSVNYESGAPVDELTPAQKKTITAHKLRSKNDAQDLVTPARDRGAGAAMNSARNRELLALVPASLLLTAGFAAVFIERNDVLSNVSLTYGALFLGLCLAAHIVLRFTLPYADPYLFPLFAVLACFGLVMIYRIDEKLAREQAQWFVIGLGLFAATIILLRDYRELERYRYTVAAVGIGLLLLPRLPGIGSQVNGAYLGVKLGPLTFQPAEFSKIAIIVFLASYLRDTRQLLVIGARRFAGITFPPLKHFGPLLIVWGGAMVMLFFIQDLGSSLMFYGGFLAVLYVATNRFSFVAIGLTLFGVGSWALYHARPTITHRVDAWLHPFGRALRRPGRQLPDRAVGLRAGRRRPLRPRLRAGACSTSGARRCCPPRRPTSSTR